MNSNKKKIIIVCASVFLVLIVAAISMFLMADGKKVVLKKDTMQVEAGEKLEFRLGDYVDGTEEQLKKAKADISDVDTDKVGEYKIAIRYKEQEFYVRVSVKDTTPPKMQVPEDAVEIKAGESVSVDGLEIKVEDFSKYELTFSDGEKTKVFETVGEMKESVIATDVYGNESKAQVKFEVLAVNVPELYGEGLADRTVYLEDGIDLMAGIAAQDVEDGDLTAQIQVNAPDMSIPGVKEVTYIVSDSDGNVTERTIVLSVESRIEVQDVIMYASKRTTVRNTAGESGKRLGTLQYAQAVHVTGRDKINGWYQVDYDGTVGYVEGTALVDVQPAQQQPVQNDSSGNGSDKNTSGNEGAGTQGDTQNQQVTPTQQPRPSVDESQYPQRVLELVNEQRRNNGLPELSWDPQVAAAAQVRASELKVSFSHTRPDGRSCFTALTDMGINGAAGENIAMGYRTPEAVVNGWMNSQGHRANILNPSYTKLGVGYLSGGWVQLFM